MRKIIFLDRDGVINRDPAEKRYVMHWRDFEFLPGSVKALKKLNDSGYKIVVISNQAGVAKGLFSLEDLRKVNRRMLGALRKRGAEITKVYYCSHRDEDNCSCRKPRTGLFIKAIQDLGFRRFNWRQTYFVGDGRFDIEAGKRLKMRTVLVLSGKTSDRQWRSWDIKPDFVVRGLEDAVEKVIFRCRKNMPK
jgi:histidinol-phosphate phosphatase family protein